MREYIQDSRPVSGQSPSWSVPSEIGIEAAPQRLQYAFDKQKFGRYFDTKRARKELVATMREELGLPRVRGVEYSDIQPLSQDQLDLLAEGANWERAVERMALLQTTMERYRAGILQLDPSLVPAIEREADFIDNILTPF